MNDLLKPLYLAGPISGLTYEQATIDRSTDAAINEFKLAGYTPLNPLDGYESLAGKGKLPVEFEELIDGSAEEAVFADLHMIDISAAVFANYSQEAGPSLGTAAEIGYAYAKNKPIVTLLPYSAGYGANTHPFITNLSTVVTATWNEAMEALALVREQLEPLPYA